MKENQLSDAQDTYMHRNCSSCGFLMTTPDRYCHQCHEECPPPLLWWKSPSEREQFRKEMQQARADDRSAAAKDNLGLLLGLPWLLHAGIEMLIVALIPILLIGWLIYYLVTGQSPIKPGSGGYDY